MDQDLILDRISKTWQNIMWAAEQGNAMCRGCSVNLEAPINSHTRDLWMRDNWAEQGSEMYLKMEN